MNARPPRILWIINKMPPAVARLEGRHGVRGAWLDSYIEVVGDSELYELVIAYPSHEGDTRDQLIDGIRYCSLPVTRSKGGVSRVIGRWRHQVISQLALDAVRALVEQVDPDLIHLHGAEDGYGLALLDSGIPRVLSVQGSPTSILPLYVRGFDRYYVASQSVLELLRGTGAIHHHLNLAARARAERAIMASMRNVIGRTDWDRRLCAVLAPHAVYHHCDEPMRLPFHESRWSRSGAVPQRILALVGQYPWKGVGTMLRGFAEYLEQSPGAELVLVGLVNGSDHERAARRHVKSVGLGHSVRLTGEINAEQLVEELLECSVFVNPSHIENGSNALSEAMMLGVPCVATATGGMLTTTQYGRGALLVQDGDAEALAGALLEMDRNPETASAIADEGFRIARARHDRQTILNQLVSIYSEILDESPGTVA